MRFHRLDLIKYGKFSDCSIDFPAGGQDFHLIVGRNEAGKSTLRSAIADLLFGMPHRSSMGFMYPLSELRLGARVSNGSESLEFHRTRAQKQSLRSPLDDPLADTALGSFLGTADRNFFEQMFGLDQARLMEGGKSILNAESDLGQILFQAASGVASLGKVRNALFVEAEKLWAPRKSADRAYYIAARQLEEANAALKAATVRTRDWAEASREAERLQEEIATERTQHSRLQIERNRLERIRRLAPLLRMLRENESQLHALGEGADLPADAAGTLSVAEQDIAQANLLLELRTADIRKAEDELGKIQVDEAVLAAVADIEKLGELRLQYGAHEGDIERREAEKAALWADIRNACTQLGWLCESEEMVARRLPGLLVRRELGQLAREHSGLAEGLRAAERAEKTKQSDIQSLKDQLAGLQSGEVSPALRAAIENVRRLGDADVAVQKEQAIVARKSAELEQALQDLGQWRMPLPALAAINPPGQKAISRLMQDRQSLVADERAISQQRDSQQTAIDRTALKIAQLRKLHPVSTREEVLHARARRDVAWSAIKKGEASLTQGAEKFETALIRADEVSDILLDNVGQATELQSLQHQLEREEQDLSTTENRHARLRVEIAQLDADWAERMLGLGLAGMPLDDFVEWLGKREAARAAGTACEEAEDGFRIFSVNAADLKAGLVKALRDAGLQTDGALGEDGADSLSTLARRAEAFIGSVNEAETQRKTLSAQLHTAQAAVKTLQQAAEDAKAAENKWTRNWSDALQKAALPPDSSPAAVEGALELIQDVEKKLRKMREIQTDRIDAMRADLDRLATEARCLALVAAPGMEGQPAEDVIRLLGRRLAAAQAAAAETARLKEVLREAREGAGNAGEAIKTAQASLQPLMQRAGVDSPALLAEAIARSDEKRRLGEEGAKARTGLLEHGDGLALEQIGRECEAADLQQIAAELMRIDSELADAVNRQNALAADYAHSSRTLAEIGGSDAAARAEAQRQQAIADMADAAERYIKIFTAGRLLRWSIERYREEKQGPLLARAGALFSNFTLGSFQRLVVDFDREPVSLEGLRSNGKQVGISGMSEGTCDQLYLALRLAALELHLEQSMPLPFIADDLFVNYDDARAEAGLEALRALSGKTQVIFLTHHAHLVPCVQRIFGNEASIIEL